MTFDVTPLIPVVGTVAAALVAGGIARANLIASKETKVSEFRQAWINALRDDLASLFSNARTVCRAMQEARLPAETATPDFLFPREKVVNARHTAGETYHRIRLRLNAGQPDHKELRRLLEVMMQTLQEFLSDPQKEAWNTITEVEAAALYAEGVLKAEWQTVKDGEAAYKAAVRMTKHTLTVSLSVLAALVIAIPLIAYFAPESQPQKVVVKLEASVPTPTPAAQAASAMANLRTNPPDTPKRVQVPAASVSTKK